MAAAQTEWSCNKSTHTAEVKITDAAAASSVIQLFSRFSKAREREKSQGPYFFFFCLSFNFFFFFSFFSAKINQPEKIEQERQVIKEIRSAFGPMKKLLRQEIICVAIAIDGNTTPAGGPRFNKNRDLERDDFFNGFG